MAKSVLDIVIKLSKQGGADKETVTGLVKVKSAMLEAAAVAGTLVAAGFAIAKVWEQTAGVAVSYANEVRGVTQSTGLQAEEASKLIQVLDDMKISYDDLQKAVAKNGDKFDYSIQGLAKMSDAYKALGTEQERTEFMQERFGKNWVQFVEVMQQGSEKLLSAGNDINEALILDDKALESAREYEKNLDNMNDGVMALKVSIGNELIPAFNEWLEISNNTNKAMAAGSNEYEARRQAAIALTATHAVMNDAESKHVNSSLRSYAAWAEAVQNVAANVDILAAAIDVNYSQIIGLTQSISDAQTSYAENVAQTNADITLTDEERKIKLQELATEYEAATNKIVAANFLQQLSVDGVTQAEFEMYTEFQVATGAMTESAAAQALALNEITLAAANGEISIAEMKAAIDALQDKTVTLNVVTNYSEAGQAALYTQIMGEKGYANGTNGWETVPAGYPNDSYMVGLTSGEEFMVVPNGGGAQPAAGGGRGGGSGGGNITVVLSMNSVVSMADKEEIKKMQPYVFDMIREAQAQGVIG